MKRLGYGVLLGLFFLGCGGQVVDKLEKEDLKVGNGPVAKEGDTVEVHYTGWLLSGTKFDSSVGKEPFSFTLGESQVIKGWDQGVVGMKVGGKRKLTIPAELAYGRKGAPPTIPPDSVLVFEVELLNISLDEQNGQLAELKKEDVKVGTGAEAKTGDRVEVHYTGKFTNGQKFDSSLDRGKPFSFKLGAGDVIKGWDQGVVGMKVGGQRKLSIPYRLAYGEQGRPPRIPARSDLIFDVELLGIK